MDKEQLTRLKFAFKHGTTKPDLEADIIRFKLILCGLDSEQIDKISPRDMEIIRTLLPLLEGEKPNPKKAISEVVNAW